MKVLFDDNDIVVMASAYGHKIVCSEEPGGGLIYSMVDLDEDMQQAVFWRGSFESCVAAMVKDMQQVALTQEPIWRQPDPEVNSLLARTV